MPTLPARAVLAVIWLAIAFAASHSRVARILVSVIGAVPVMAVAGFVSFGLTNQWVEHHFVVKAPGNWVMITVGILVGALSGLYVGWLGGRILWVYWLIQILLVLLAVLVPLAT